MPKYYLLDENKNLVEGFDKEGFLALLQEAIDQGSLENIDPESAVASKLRSVLNGTTHHIEFVTQAQYNELENEGELVPNTYYFITDDTTLEGLNRALNDLTRQVNEDNEDIGKIKDGTTSVPKAKEVTEKIQGALITDIFEPNSTDVKNATNVKEKINGVNISNIFAIEPYSQKMCAKFSSFTLATNNGYAGVQNVSIRPTDTGKWSASGHYAINLRVLSENISSWVSFEIKVFRSSGMIQDEFYTPIAKLTFGGRTYEYYLRCILSSGELVIWAYRDGNQVPMDAIFVKPLE